jgi:response regulator RpfG family c-di-GMP phosphodiesterase
MKQNTTRTACFLILSVSLVLVTAQGISNNYFKSWAQVSQSSNNEIPRIIEIQDNSENGIDISPPDKSFYALIISDLRMPIINGTQLLKTVKDLNPGVRTVLMTAFDMDKLFQEYCNKEIINGFAQKPISLDNLVIEVSNQLHSYELQKIHAS